MKSLGIWKSKYETSLGELPQSRYYKIPTSRVLKGVEEFTIQSYKARRRPYATTESQHTQ